MNKPLVSVIIPTYNRGHIIERAINSILEQTCQDFEIIVVDDNSKDNTIRLLTDLVKKDPRIRYLQNNEQKGAQFSRNKGIKSANGKWIAFLDSDDYWLRCSLEARLDIIERYGVKVVYSECNKIDANGIIKPFNILPFSGYIYHELLENPFPMFQGLLVAKDAIEEIGFLDEKIISYQEWDTSIRLAKYYPFGFVKQPTFVYDCQGSDTMSKNMLLDVEGYRQVFNKHILEILKLFNPRVLRRHYRYIASGYGLVGNYLASFYYKIVSFLWLPFCLIEKISYFITKIFHNKNKNNLHEKQNF